MNHYSNLLWRSLHSEAQAVVCFKFHFHARLNPWSPSQQKRMLANALNVFPIWSYNDLIIHGVNWFCRFMRQVRPCYPMLWWFTAKGRQWDQIITALDETLSSWRRQRYSHRPDNGLSNGSFLLFCFTAICVIVWRFLSFTYYRKKCSDLRARVMKPTLDVHKVKSSNPDSDIWLTGSGVQTCKCPGPTHIKIFDWILPSTPLIAAFQYNILIGSAQPPK